MLNRDKHHQNTLEMKLVRELQLVQEVTDSADVWRRFSENFGYFLRNAPIKYIPHIQNHSVQSVEVVNKGDLNKIEKMQLNYFGVMLNIVLSYAMRKYRTHG